MFSKLIKSTSPILCRTIVTFKETTKTKEILTLVCVLLIKLIIFIINIICFQN